ncbi:MAG: choice-of-anchor Q domain-containing protein [Anaerolineales bacterium]
MKKNNLFPYLYSILSITLFIGLALIAFVPTGGQAAGFITVNSPLDELGNDGMCTLREAVIAANTDKASGKKDGECPAGNGSDTIELPTGTYLLTRTDSGNEDSSSTGDLDIRGDLIIQGQGAEVTLIQAVDFKDRLIHVLQGRVEISGVTLSAGSVTGSGGAIYNLSELSLYSSAVTGNQASENGGGVYNAPGATFTLQDSTLSDNHAGADGGALADGGGMTTVANSTLSGNTAGGLGGGMANAGSAGLESATLANNQSGLGGGGLVALAGTTSIHNTLIAGNQDQSASSADCSGTLDSQGYNLIGDGSGCSLAGTSDGDLLNLEPLLAPLDDNGGSTQTQALLTGSPAIDAGDSLNCPATDQRGVQRPQGATCDIGAFEVVDPVQTGPVYTVNTAQDVSDSACTFSDCSLREAIQAANAQANGAAPEEIHFNIPGSGSPVIEPLSPLPAISDPVVIDGATQPSGAVEIRGGQAGEQSTGVTIQGGNSLVRGLALSGFAGAGLSLEGAVENRIEGNRIFNNGGAGVQVLSGAGNLIQNNLIFDNGGLAIDLGADGVTANDPGDGDDGANNSQNYAVIRYAVPQAGDLRLAGRLNSLASSTYEVEFFSNASCDPSNYGEGETRLGSFNLDTGPDGNALFDTTLPVSVPPGRYVTATATGADGSTSEFSQCMPVGADNDSWVKALALDLAPDASQPGTLAASAAGFITNAGQSRWYSFSVQPNSKVLLTLENLPANYDLTLYKDIAQAYQQLQGTADLTRLSAEFAPDAFSPDAFSPDAFSPDAFSPDAFSPDAFSPDAFSPDAFSPDAFSPDAFSPDAFSPDAFSPDAFSPDAFSPDAFSPDAFSPDAFSPDAFSPDAFSSAQTRSLIGVSAFNGLASEGLLVNTWNQSGDFYVRVRSSNGEFSLNAPFQLGIRLLTGTCSQVSPDLPPTSLAGVAGDYHTIILADLARVKGSADEKTLLQNRLAEFASRPEVAGVVVDVSSDARVSAANNQADAYPQCPFAKNLVASSIKTIIDDYNALNPLDYIVILGNDDAIPFFRYADNALLANESNYAPPVRDNTASQASLKLGYVLSQDGYASSLDLAVKNDTLPLPGMAVGRLVETAPEITGMLEAYLSTQDGVVATPTTALVTGYDFLADSALAIQNELSDGTGSPVDALITPRGVSPADPTAWTADDLRALLLGNRHDLVYLAGHFSASSMLAADFSTRMLTSDLINSPLDLKNALIFSPGCHSSYNIVDAHDVPGVTREPDWPQAFARKLATLVGGTGYQYGDTDFLEYSERLYYEFSRQLKAGTGPVAVGQALVEAKRAYLADTPQLRGIHQKAYLEATLYGLPMLKIELPQDRGDAAKKDSIIAGTNTYTSNPGLTLGLAYADVHIDPVLNLHSVDLTDPGTGDVTSAAYLSGSDGTMSNPVEPTLPLETRNVSVPGTVLRGIGFRGGDYIDTADVLPLTGAAASEVRGVHTSFQSNVFYPVTPYSANYYEALSGAGSTYLSVTPAQYRSNAPGDQLSTQRAFQSMDLRLFYSSNTSAYANNSVPGLAAPPAISQVVGQVINGAVQFSVRVVGNPAAGIQEVWVPYTLTSNPQAGVWQSLDLLQNPADTSLWEGTLNLGNSLPDEVRYFVQAVNGVGLVAADTNNGAFYIPIPANGPAQPTELTLETPDGTAPFGTQATFSALLTSGDQPLSGEVVEFKLGPLSRSAVSGADGRAQTKISLLALPQDYFLTASYAGTSQYQPASDNGNFTIVKRATQISLQPQSTSGYTGDEGLIVATLSDAGGRPLAEKTVVFVITGNGKSYSEAVISDYAGRAPLGALPLPHGVYQLQAYFSGQIPLPEGDPLILEDASYLPSSASDQITILNSAPVALDDAYSLQEDSVLNIPIPGVLINDRDADGDALIAILETSPSHGTLNLLPDGSFSYTPDGNFNGADSFSYYAYDGELNSNLASVALTVAPVNDPPVCSTAEPSTLIFWPPSNDFVAVHILGVTDPEGSPVTITIDRIFQDEPVGSGTLSPDGRGVGSAIAEIRSERDGDGDGRVYHIYFTASDGMGGTCSGEVGVGISDNQGGGIEPYDDGPLYDSTVPSG